MIRIAIGTDHRGYKLKNKLIEKSTIGSHEINWIDVGTNSSERTDYPLYARKVVELLNKEADLGILLCGSGIGIAIAANRYKGIYAGLVWNETLARVAKEHDNVNVLVLPADYISDQQAIVMIDAWLSTPFKGGRYQERLEQIDEWTE